MTMAMNQTLLKTTNAMVCSIIANGSLSANHAPSKAVLISCVTGASLHPNPSLLQEVAFLMLLLQMTISDPVENVSQ